VTRINCVPVGILHGEHLVAEYRELPRAFGLVRAAIARGENAKSVRERAPATYTLGTGHVLFFLVRLGYLAVRQDAIVREMLARGYKPQFTERLTRTNRDIPDEWWGLWAPTPQATAANMARLRERKPDFYGSKEVVL